MFLLINSDCFFFRNVTLCVENMIQERIISNILGVVKGHFESGKILTYIKHDAFLVGLHLDFADFFLNNCLCKLGI